MLGYCLLSLLFNFLYLLLRGGGLPAGVDHRGQSHGTVATLGGVAALASGRDRFWCGGVSPGQLVGAGDDLLRAGVADRLFCESRPGLAGELAAGRRGPAAGRLRDNPGPFVLRSGGV